MSGEIETAPTRPSDLRGQVVRGVVWVISAQTVIRVVGFGTMTVLVRLLGPTNIGLAAEALVFTRLAFLFSDVGLGAVLVQRKELSEVDKSTAFWTSAMVGLSLSLSVIAVSRPIAGLFRNQQVRPLVMVLSLYVLFTALGVTPNGLLARDLRFRTLELRTMLAALLAAIAAVAMAVLGFGAWAIVTQLVVNAAASTSLLWLRVGWRPRFTYSVASLRHLAGFSSYIFGAGLASFLHRNTDNFLVGRFLGPAKLGAYSTAYDVMQWPLMALSAPVSDVLFPAMTKLRDPDQIGDVWLRVTRLAVVITAPAFLGMIVVAPDFVDVVFGPRWHEAIPVLQILSYVGLIQSLTILVGNVLMTLDRAATLFWLAFPGSLAMVGAFAVGLKWGLIGVTVAYAAANTPLTAMYAVVAARSTNVSLRNFARAMRGVVGAAAAMAVAVLALRLVLVAQHVSPAARLAIVTSFGVLVFVLLCVWAAGEVVSEIRALVRRAATFQRSTHELVSPVEP